MNHIQNISIRNFKSVQHCNINDCNRINVFVGPPNVGKSNILEAMGLCSLIEGNSRSSYLNDYVRYEKISSLFYKKDIDNPFSVLYNEEAFGITGIVEKENSLSKFILSHYNRKNESQGWRHHLAELSLSFFIDDNLHLKNYEDKEINKIGAKSRGSTGSFDVQETSAINYLKNGIIKRYKFREDLKLKDYSTNELHIPFGENIGTFLANKSSNKLNEAITNLVSPDMFIADKEDYRYLKSYPNKSTLSFSFNEIADTLQRIIFHLSAIMSNSNSVLLFEEPESHCYEPYILDFTNAIKFDEQNNQYFIVTHSDYIVKEFLREERTRNETNIYLVGLDDNQSTIVKLADRKISDDVYEFGTNVFFNYEELWSENV